ncbi:MAG: DUF1570 domain-containing protein [Planctomycetes bacterium]|nr:DUF1570 domain-containing protein [Planctomycetota bacterium]
MLYAGVGAGALVLVIAIAGFMIGGKNKDSKDSNGQTKEEASKDAEIEKLRKYADDSPQMAYEYAEAMEKKGKKAEAEEYYLKAAKDPKFEKVQLKLLSWYREVKLREAGGDVAKQIALLDWLGKAHLDDEAKTLAATILKQSPDCEKAHQLCGDEKVGDKWYSKDEADLARVSISKSAETGAYAKLSARDKKIYSLKQEYNTAWGKEEKDRVYLDCAPDAPHVLCMERSSGYNADLMVQAFKDCVVTLYKLFFQRYSSLFDVKSFGENEVTFIYIFESRDRYASSTGSPQWAGGHFDTRNHCIFIYKDTNQLYETLFHEGIHQLVDTVSQMKVAKLKERRSVNMFWFTEGLATFFESFKRDATGGFILGEVSPHYMPQIRKMIADGKHLKLPDMMKISYSEFGQKSGDVQFVGRMYCQSWSVVYFLYTYAGGKYKDKFNEYFKREVDEKGSFDAAKECFGDLDAMNKEYEEFYKNMK